MFEKLPWEDVVSLMEHFGKTSRFCLVPITIFYGQDFAPSNVVLAMPPTI